MKKGFLIDLEESLTYPTTDDICNYIEKYSQGDKEPLEFVSKEKPVTFYLGKDLYEAQVDMARGGYIIHCVQI